MSGIDWSQAPEEATGWAMSEFGAVWTVRHLVDVTTINSPKPESVEGVGVCGQDFAPAFGYPYGVIVDIEKPGIPQ